MRKQLGLVLMTVMLTMMWRSAHPVQAQEATAEPQGSPGISIVMGEDVYTRAGNAFSAGQYAQAIQDYSLFILLNPTFAEGFYWRGMSYGQLGETERGLADMKRALELPALSAKFTSRVHYSRAVLFLQEQDTTSALAELDEAIQAAPDDPDAYYQRARVEAALQEYQKALSDMDRVIELAPDQQNAYYDRGFIQVQLGNLDDAARDFSKLIELAPDDARGYTGRAGVYLNQEKPEAALADLNAAIDLRTDAPGLYLQRGLVNNLLGNQRAAAADYFQWMRMRRTNVNTEHTLRPGESQVVEMDEGLIYLMGFEGKAGQVVTLSATSRQAETTDPLLVLLDASGNPIVADDDGAGNYDSLIQDFTLPADGPYTLAVGHAGGGSNGPVRVLLDIAE